MHSQTLLIAALAAAGTNAHGMIRSIEGANGVIMPGLSVADGTPRDCSSNGCGSQADTAIIRDREISSGEVGPLGRTQGNGPIDAATMIASFMGGGNAPTNNGASDSVGQEDDIPNEVEDADEEEDDNNNSTNNNNNGNNNNNKVKSRQLLGGLLGGGGGNGGGIGGLFGGGGAGTDAEGPPETMVASTAGSGSSSGLPTASDDGIVRMTFLQINQDGAGPLSADIDGTSGGTDESAFQSADVVTDVPGLGIQGLSLATSTEFPVEVQMPQGMTCDASVGGADNVCVVRVRNTAAAGPFGGSAAFTQSNAGRKRAVAYRLRKRMEFRA